MPPRTHQQTQYDWIIPAIRTHRSTIQTRTFRYKLRPRSILGGHSRHNVGNIRETPRSSIRRHNSSLARLIFIGVRVADGPFHSPFVVVRSRHWQSRYQSQGRYSPFSTPSWIQMSFALNLRIGLVSLVSTSSSSLRRHTPGKDGTRRSGSGSFLCSRSSQLERLGARHSQHVIHPAFRFLDSRRPSVGSEIALRLVDRFKLLRARHRGETH